MSANNTFANLPALLACAKTTDAAASIHRQIGTYSRYHTQARCCHSRSPRSAPAGRPRTAPARAREVTYFGPLFAAVCGKTKSSPKKQESEKIKTGGPYCSRYMASVDRKKPAADTNEAKQHNDSNRKHLFGYRVAETALSSGFIVLTGWYLWCRVSLFHQFFSLFGLYLT